MYVYMCMCIYVYLYMPVLVRAFVCAVLVERVMTGADGRPDMTTDSGQLYRSSEDIRPMTWSLVMVCGHWSLVMTCGFPDDESGQRKSWRDRERGCQATGCGDLCAVRASSVDRGLPVAVRVGVTVASGRRAVISRLCEIRWL